MRACVKSDRQMMGGRESDGAVHSLFPKRKEKMQCFEQFLTHLVHRIGAAKKKRRC